MMKPKVYQAATMAMALGEVKRDLGSSAIIHRTRSFRKGGLLGLIGGKKVWEVRASAETGLGRDELAGTYVPVGRAWKAAPFATDQTDDDGNDLAGGQASQFGAPLAERIAEIHKMVARLLTTEQIEVHKSIPDSLVSIRQAMLDQDIEQRIVDELIAAVGPALGGRSDMDIESIMSVLLELVTARIVTESPESKPPTDGPMSICLIGPTGVGKTTTIAKLAANFKIRQHKSVGLITMDTYRIAAVDQLRTYAEIIEVPIEAVLTPGELHKAIHAMGELDVVLIDTAGRSQKDEMKLGELRRFVDAAGCDEVHLVISASSSWKVASAAIERFAPLGANRIIMSKLDEAETFGMILNVCDVGSVPISHVTTGQGVPDDIAPADAGALARCVVTGSCYAN